MSHSDLSSELGEAGDRPAELEAVEAERAHAAKVQEALYRIAELASAAHDLQDFYRKIHGVVAELMYANNCYIALYDEERRLISWPYYVDEVDTDIPDPRRWDHFGSGDARGATAYVLRTAKPQHLPRESYQRLIELGELDLVGDRLAEDWLGVPLRSGDDRTVGVLVVQSYEPSIRFTEQDEELLAFVAQHVGAALSRARAIEETRQRNAELALINSVQEALAGELELQAIYDAVGDRIRDVFDAQVVDIAIYDETSALLHFPYAIERGERFADEPMELIGFRKHVMKTRESLMLPEISPEVVERYGNPFVLAGEPIKSALFVPLVVRGRATGVISLQNIDRTRAFGESDQQLLETLAGSLSVALENARLVHETRQRNAELALINSVQDSIAGELDQQAIYDVVGTTLRDVFDAQVVAILIYDESSGLLHDLFTLERGERLHDEPSSPIGFSKHVLETRESVLITENLDAEVQRYGSSVPIGEAPKSVLFVPLVTSGKATGVISLQNLDREHAFSESDQQLLETLAGSLSVALENARLVHETRQRNAELALINSVQEAIAGELDPQAIYDAVGDRIRDVFDAQVVDIAIYDAAGALLEFPYVIERGERLHEPPLPLFGFRKHVMETRGPLLITESTPQVLERYGNPAVLGGNPSKSALFVPLLVGGRATGVVSLQNVDRTHAFGEDDQRLLTTLAGSLSVALDNARLVHETRQRLAELATVNRVGQALSSQLDLDALIELVGERVRETFEADIAYVALHDQSSGRIDFAYYYERGEHEEQAPLTYGEGLTSRILESQEPLLLNRSPQFEAHEPVGTSVRSYLGVPILVGDTAIGVISVQSIEEEGRFGEDDSRLLATIAANVGVAIHNARLFSEVERQRGYLESLVSISPAAVVVLDPEELVTDWNPAAAELFGYSAEEAVGQPIDDLLFGGSVGHEEGREVTEEAMREGRSQRITLRRRRDGTLAHVELMLVPLTVDDAHVGFLGVYHDVTELQRARQEAETATQAKSAFLATMSHEIRTPMNAVIGMTDLLLGTDLTDEQRDFAEVVRTSGDALLHVIDDILDYSKIEAGKLDLEREPFGLRECVEGALDIVAPRAWDKGIELGCLIDEAAPAGILGDGARVRQVLLNLLSNGVKFTEAGEVVILVHAEPTGPGSYRLELLVRDTGIGIRPDRMDRLFTSFSQVDASTTRRFGGTGLGLAISKRLVDLMGGTITVESEPGRGSTFRIALPVTAADVPGQIHLDEGLPRLAGKRVLIVDDNATNREIVVRHARSWGMEPVAVEFPGEALALVEAGEPFDVAVLDMMMPDMDGLALGAEIRRRRSEQDLPLLLLTSLGRLPEEQWSGAFSAQLAKPLRASQLYNTLVQLLSAGEPGVEKAEVPPDDTEPVLSLRILLAEDNAMNQKVALRLLERLGYRADVVSNGLEALEALERHPYDVVLMDVQMPRLDGLDATRRIRERWPPESRPHIIAMTANALPEDRDACFAAGMNDYVAKPIRADELATALKRSRPLPNPEADSGESEISLDAAALQNLRDLGGAEFVTEVVDVFLSDAPALITSLSESLERQDAEELRRAAHTLKANGATLGAVAFANACRIVEQHAKEGRLDGVAQLVAEIEHEYQTLQQALAPLRSESAS
jgi:PAS domain S-box-containing protein